MARAEEKKRPKYLGVLTTLGDAKRGLVGGFLVLNAVGRPVEFHCTTPARPNRAQEILYGVTLESFVCGEQIAPALVGRAKTELAGILTNNPNVLSAKDALNAPIILVFQHSDAPIEEGDRQKYAIWEKNAEQNSIQEGASGFQPPVFYRSMAETPPVPGLDFDDWEETVVGKNRVAAPKNYIQENGGKIPFAEIIARLELFFKSIDSVEPFERIRLAIEEAQKAR